MTDPFVLWAIMARALRDNLVKELGQKITTPYAGELAGSLAGLITHLGHLSGMLQRLERNDLEVHAAFLRAVERTAPKEMKS